MFSSAARIKKRTPEGGIGREDYIEHLAEEFHTTTDIEAQEQVLANLANFAYDPINYRFLKKSSVLDIFLQSLDQPNEKLVSHGIGGITNFCLDPDISLALVEPNNLRLITSVLQSTTNKEISINCITLFHLLLTTNIDNKPKICSPEVVQKISKLKDSECGRLANLANVFITDFCTKKVNLE